MTGEEERLYARAEMLDETGDLAQAVAEVLHGAQGAGVDPRAVISLTAALQTLDPGAAVSYSAGSRKDRQDGSGYSSDGEFLEALSDAEDQVRDHLREVKAVQEQVSLALDRAQDDLGQARRDLEAAREALAAAYTMPTRRPCDGCHRCPRRCDRSRRGSGRRRRGKDRGRGTPDQHLRGRRRPPRPPRRPSGPGSDPAADGTPGPRRGVPARLCLRPFRGEAAAVRALDRRSERVRPAGTYLLRREPY